MKRMLVFMAAVFVGISEAPPKKRWAPDKQSACEAAQRAPKQVSFVEPGMDIAYGSMRPAVRGLSAGVQLALEGALSTIAQDIFERFGENTEKDNAFISLLYSLQGVLHSSLDSSVTGHKSYEDEVFTCSGDVGKGIAYLAAYLKYQGFVPVSHRLAFVEPLACLMRHEPSNACALIQKIYEGVIAPFYCRGDAAHGIFSAVQVIGNFLEELYEAGVCDRPSPKAVSFIPFGFDDVEAVECLSAVE